MGNAASGPSMAVTQPSVDLMQYTAARTPALLPYQYRVPAEMRTLRGARSYEVESAMVKRAPYVNFAKHAARTGVIADIAEGVTILDIVEIGKLAGGSPAEYTKKAESVIET